MTIDLRHGDALNLLTVLNTSLDLIATDPPYSFSGTGIEHALSATVAIVLREAAQKLRQGRWMLVMCAASWRSTAYMIEAVRGIVEPVRFGTWCKPSSRTKARISGWQWASVHVIVFRKGKATMPCSENYRDYILAPPQTTGRRATLPPEVATWMIHPFAVPDGVMLDPFAGSGILVQTAAQCGMHAIGFEKHPEASV